MTRLLSTVALATAFVNAALAAPTNEPEVRVATIEEMIGFDPDYVEILSADSIIPEVITLSEEDVANTTHIESVDPSGQEDAIAKRYIEHPDDRYQFSSTAYPFGATGKLRWSNGGWCSGAMVGPRHVLTAKHCISSGVSGTFTPGFDNGYAPFGVGQVTHVINNNVPWGSGCGWKEDWAVLILNERVGERSGYFGVKYPEHNKNNQEIFTHIGYPQDRDSGNRPYRVDGNQIEGHRSNWECDSTGPYYTETDCIGGQSGGPHWESLASGPYIWGTLAVTLAAGNDAWSGWGSGNGMVDTVGRLRDEFP